ncbi:hypothetical protein B0H12DRAFT_98813 [Mycena haematopus]|nr:hypothetical protein B0H12DRAFT_98813 [Mycena haematopus]
MGFEAEMSDIDKEIAWHYTQIASLKAKRNAIAPIRRLPNELMIRILIITAVESNTLFNLKWMKLMYVCRHWHDLALEAQPLWAFIDTQWRGAGAFSRLFGQLKRSGAAPLTLKTKFPESSSYYIDAILEHSERIRDLQLGGESQQVHELIAKLTDYKFPLLFSLSLDASLYLDRLPEDLVRDLPEALLVSGLPSLRELTLNTIAFPWTSLSGLTELALTECHDSSTTLPQTFHGLLDMLASCPQLHTLKLEIIIPPPLPDQLYATVELPALTWLYLRDPVISCELLLNHLRIPATAAIQLLPLDVRSGADVRGLLVPIHRHLRAIGARTPMLFKIARPGLSYCTMTMCNDTAPRTFMDYDSPDCPFSLNCHPSMETTLRQILRKVLKAIPTESITHIDGRDGYDVGPVTWRAVMLLLPALDTIYLQLNTGAVKCVGALHEIESLDPQHQTFPHLRHLHIRLIRVDAATELIVVLLNALEEYLQKCCTSGNSLKTLEFEDAFHVLAGHESSLERFFSIVTGEILWNGVIFDPIKRREALAKWEAERQAMAAELGIEI